MRNVLNRMLLGVAGLVLCALGALVLVAAEHPARRLPALGQGPGTPVGEVTWINPSAWDGGRAHGWWPLAVGAALALLLALLLWALWRQVRGAALPRLPLGRDGLTLGARALTRALEHHLRTLPGVAHARVHAHGSAHAPRLRLALTLDGRAGPADTLDALTREVLPTARGALAPKPLSADIRIEGGRRERHRAR